MKFEYIFVFFFIKCIIVFFFGVNCFGCIFLSMELFRIRILYFVIVFVLFFVFCKLLLRGFGNIIFVGEEFIIGLFVFVL